MKGFDQRLGCRTRIDLMKPALQIFARNLA
jgi:hypothetical protein